ncbi:beta-lactamase-like protein [Pyronema omphalodes]|nr:beta-lactamase-like protein [Pyronema omphalodes]
MQIHSIPMRTGRGDNYSYLVIDDADATHSAMIIDPAFDDEVLPILQDFTTNRGIKLVGIINTHHHFDHAGNSQHGNIGILSKYPGLPVIAGEKCHLVTKTPGDGEVFRIGSLEVRALHTPCHTQDSICYYIEEKKGDKDGMERVVFTGDTLFIAGCGRFFEGTAKEMNVALNKTLAELPDDTKVYPGHEYTRDNVRFAEFVLPNNEAVKRLRGFCEENKQTQGRFTIGDEKKHNVFMMLEDPDVIKATDEHGPKSIQGNGPVQVMEKLRTMKNGFRG